ncbi:MAG: reprolysin-like metallopeptidase [Lysobacter sp.]
MAALLLCGVGCTPTARPVASHAQAQAPFNATSGRLGESGLGVATATSRHSFASLPDRGELVEYPAKAVSRRDGAYTWHRAFLSEAHALKAIVTGVMEITTPSGEALKFRYERHVEHSSGDLTWVGRLQGGQQSDEVILTFGDKAVFGSISQPGKPPLRLTMSGGGSWLVETDPAKIANIDNDATRPSKPDYLIPPKSADGRRLVSDTPFVSPAATPVMVSSGATATTVVDVLIGYTPGFAAANNGAPLTRLNNMVETTNQAYINSGVDSRARLVHAMQVDYPDNTDNGNALEEMTGFRAPSTRTTPAAAFNALRAAREQYGADLVSLVRKFNTPENSGCGIAWLIGGGQSGIANSDEYFGYSVVSDGIDSDSDGKNYFCREETLAHELGHNMGSQHDAIAAQGSDGLLNANEYGAYPYSFGYKTAVDAGNFYTVMAYGDKGQTSYRTFSNSQSTYCGGQLCGASSADNARSLRQTIPLISSFRATVVADQPISVDLIDAKAYDFNADGRSDLMWRFDAQSDWAYWTMNGGAKIGGVGYGVGSEWRVVASGDFQGDGRWDVIWTNGSSMQMWLGSPSGFIGAVMPNYPADWRVVAVGDINADGTSDLVWRDSANNNAAIWLMQGAMVFGTRGYSVPPAWRVLGSGDLTGDDRLDIVWTDGASMQLWAGTSVGTFAGLTMPGYPAGWALFGVGDVDGDNMDDLLWRHAPTGQVAYWRMAGATKLSGVGFIASVLWRPIQVADLSGDGKVDIVWTDGTAMQLWASTGSVFTGVAMPGYPVAWSPIRR